MKDTGVHAFPKGIGLKVNIIARLGFELSHFEVAVQYFIHYCLQFFLRYRQSIVGISLKMIAPIHLHGKYYRYKGKIKLFNRARFQLQNTFFHISTNIDAFLLVINKSLLVMFRRICASRGNPLFTTAMSASLSDNIARVVRLSSPWTDKIRRFEIRAVDVPKMQRGS